MARPLATWVLALLALLLAACGTTRGTPQAGSSTRSGGHDPTRTGQIAFAASRKERCEAVLPIVQAAAVEFGVDAALLVGIIRVESNFRTDARSKAGAIGLMQVMPATGKGLGCANLLDPTVNVRCGAKLLARLHKRYEGRLIYMLSAYNAGLKWPNDARDESRLPKNFRYVESVLMARTHFLNRGCEP